MYLTFEEYISEYGGELNETAFTSYSTEAETIIDWYTFNRLIAEQPQDIPVRVKQCEVKIIALLQLRDKLLTDMATAGQASSDTSNSGGSGAIRSQSNDGVSISYNTIESSDLYNRLSGLTTQNADNEFSTTIKLYLNGVKNSKGRVLLYRGLYPGE